MIADLRDARERKPLPPAVIRELSAADRGFVFGNYLKSAHAAYAYRNMAEPAFKHFGALMLEQIVARSQVIIACTKADAGELLGFAIAERPFKNIDHIVLHFAYVKHDYRGQGLCTALVKALGHEPPRTQLFSTHMTVAWFHVGAKYGAIYNPFFLWPQFHLDKEAA